MSPACFDHRLRTLALVASVSAVLLGASCGPGPGPDGGTDAGPGDGGAADAGPDDGGLADGGDGDGGEADGGPAPIESLSRLSSLEDIDALVGAQGLV